MNEASFSFSFFLFFLFLSVFENERGCFNPVEITSYLSLHLEKLHQDYNNKNPFSLSLFFLSFSLSLSL